MALQDDIDARPCPQSRAWSGSMLILEADTTDRKPVGPVVVGCGIEEGSTVRVQKLPVVAGRTVLTRRPIVAVAGNVVERTGTEMHFSGESGRFDDGSLTGMAQQA